MKLIMENWKKFLVEQDGPEASVEELEKMYKDALYLYHAVVMGYFRATDTYLEKGRAPAEDEVEKILKRVKSAYLNKAYDNGLGSGISARASQLDNKIAGDVKADGGRGHDSDLGDLEEYLKKAFLSEPKD